MTSKLPIHPTILKRARRLRGESTMPERTLWARLRDRRLNKIKFRRQHPIGPFVADFYCDAHRLVIELDGRTHPENNERDATRTYWLSDHGYRVVRFTNRDITTNLDGVLETILAECRQRARETETVLRTRVPSPQPSPTGRGSTAVYNFKLDARNGETQATSPFGRGRSLRDERSDRVRETGGGYDNGVTYHSPSHSLTPALSHREREQNKNSSSTPQNSAVETEHKKATSPAGEVPRLLRERGRSLRGERSDRVRESGGERDDGDTCKPSSTRITTP